MAVLVLYYYFHIVFILEFSISVFWKSKVLAYTIFETMIFLLPISGDHILSSSTKTFATDVIKCLIMFDVYFWPNTQHIPIPGYL